jgi:hypothetical protein
MRHRTLADILRDTHVAPQMQDTLARIVKNLGGGRPPIVFSTTILANVNNAVETQVGVTPPISPGIDSAVILVLFMWGTFAVGTTGTQAIMRVRQGNGVAGAVVNINTNETVIAGNTYSNTAFVVDTPGAVAGLQYSGTVSVTAATAVTNTNQMTMLAMAIG